jgi:hypothetical protein
MAPVCSRIETLLSRRRRESRDATMRIAAMRPPTSNPTERAECVFGAGSDSTTGTWDAMGAGGTADSVDVVAPAGGGLGGPCSGEVAAVAPAVEDDAFEDSSGAAVGLTFGARAGLRALVSVVLDPAAALGGGAVSDVEVEGADGALRLMASGAVGAAGAGACDVAGGCASCGAVEAGCSVVGGCA